MNAKEPYFLLWVHCCSEASANRHLFCPTIVASRAMGFMLVLGPLTWQAHLLSRRAMESHFPPFNPAFRTTMKCLQLAWFLHLVGFLTFAETSS